MYIYIYTLFLKFIFMFLGVCAYLCVILAWNMYGVCRTSCRSWSSRSSVRALRIECRDVLSVGPGICNRESLFWLTYGFLQGSHSVARPTSYSPSSPDGLVLMVNSLSLIPGCEDYTQIWLLYFFICITVFIPPSHLVF